jgi:hypothetical protein
MKVTLLKDHLEWSEGEEVEVPDAMGDYWLKAGVATLAPSVPKEEVEENLQKTLKKAKAKK